MNIAFWICIMLLIAEFSIAPFNLWSGRTMPNFTNFTGLKPRVATHVFAPIKLLGALLLIVGLFERTAAAVGAGIIGLVCVVYLVLLASPKRRDPSGIFAFAVGLGCSAVVVAVALR